jgi:hypothetical protein
MKFMVQLRLQPGSKTKVVEAFDLRGPNRNPGVSFLGAWIGTKLDAAFVLVESSDESLVVKAAEAWREHGEYEFHQVIDIQQY